VNLPQLRYFIVLAEELNFQRAAFRIPCAQSSLSAQVAKLEREVGAPLLHRYPRHCELTEAGSRMYLEALRLVSAADRAVDVARGNSSRARQQLRIGVPEEGIQSLMGVLLAAYRASYPGVEVLVEQCPWSAMEDLATSSAPMFDAVIWSTDTPVAGLEGFPVYRDPLMLVVGKQTPFADAHEINPVDVLDEVMIDGGKFLQTSGHRHFLSDFRNGTAPRLTKRVFTDPIELVEGVANGAGIVAMTAGTELDGLNVQMVPLSVPTYLGVGALIRRAERRPHVRDFATMGAEIGQSLYSMIPHAVAP
jgi:DNA-binding transcriptional LysR family regulator